MAKRSNHYEAAFEAYLRDERIPYVAVDEARRALAGDESLKSVDFLVSSDDARTWIVDVKGRRFPSGGQSKQYWRNWSTSDDIRSLARWEDLFGERFEAMFVFAYHVVGDIAPLPAELLYTHRGSLYGFVAMRLRDYAACARVISPKWQTVAVPTRRFRDLAEPVGRFLGRRWRLESGQDPSAVTDLAAPPSFR